MEGDWRGFSPGFLQLSLRVEVLTPYAGNQPLELQEDLEKTFDV